jgi:hypothetical protein
VESHHSVSIFSSKQTSAGNLAGE